MSCVHRFLNVSTVSTMLQLNEVALVTFSATVEPRTETLDGKLPILREKILYKRKRIWFLLLKFKAKHRARRQQWKTETVTETETETEPNHPVQSRLQQKLKRKTTRRDHKISELDTFHRASKTVIFIGQLFGMLPVQNVRTDNPNEIDFRFKSFPMLFALLFLIFGSLRVLFVTKKSLESGITARNLVTFIFFYSNMTTFVRFIFLAKNWPKLLRHWTRVERIFLMPPYEPISNWTLRRKLQTLAITFVFLALFEHGMYFASNFYNYRMVAILCHTSNDTDNGTFKRYVTNQYDKLFPDVPYNHLLAGYALFLNSSFTFIWNYLDVFIMLVSLSLALRFQQLAKRIQRLQGRFVPENIWNELRQHHIELCELMEHIDLNFSGIVLISCFINSYFICNQLLSIFIKQRWLINYFYFWFSLFYLIGRTASVFLCAAKIHDASLLSLRSLYLVPSNCWTTEVQRFYAQIRDEPIALTGKRLFRMTRTSFFAFMATIITYEFMLLQFDAKNWKSGLRPLCQ